MLGKGVVDSESPGFAAAEQEGRWCETFAAIRDPVYVHDADFRLVRANAAAVAFAGAAAESDLVGRFYYEAMGLGDAPLASCLAAHAAERTISEEHYVASTGHWYVIESHPLFRGPSGYVGAVHVHRDVTAARRSEAALRRSEESFRVLIEQTPDAIGVHRAGRLVYVNPAMVRLLGYASPAELIGQPVSAIVHPDDRKVVVERIRAMMATGEMAPPMEERYVRKDGSVIVAEVVALALEYQGEPAIVAIGRDLTERKQLTARLMQMDRMIAVGTLAAGVGHEINNPLTFVSANLGFAAEQVERVEGVLGAILGELELRFGAEAVDDVLRVAGGTRADLSLGDLRDVLAEARTGGDRIRDIVRDLKTLSRGDDQQRGEFAVRRVIGSAIDMAFNEIRHRARLVKDFGSVPPVYGNEGRLGQVFLNLLINAAQAIDEGAAEDNEIRVSTFERDGEAVVEVRDTGKGISAENLPQIFEPFFTTKPIGHGTGLGLPICRSILGAHGGRIEVESELGKGTVFRVLLPPAPKHAEPITPVHAVSSFPVRRGRLLVVDDEPMVGRTLARTLGGDHDVVVVTSAREALTLVGAGEVFDLVLCDLMMPEMTGMDLYDRIVEGGSGLAERMIFLTGGAFTPRAKEFLERTPNLHLDKPFDAKNLRALVRRLLK